MERPEFIREQWEGKIFAEQAIPFEALALEAFQYQALQNPVYREFIQVLGISPSLITSIEKIPFLPISFFKTSEVKTGSFTPELLFESSGTTGMITSKHYLRAAAIYRESFMKGFERFFGPIENWCLLGLLPSYLERKNSSLIYMTEALIQASGHPKSGFYLQETTRLRKVLCELEEQRKPTLLIGVTFALLDFASTFPIPLQHTKIIETGGMKGRGPELVRAAVHDKLQNAFGVPVVGAEYGMTELLSQAWSRGRGIFETPPWMKVLIREEEDPLSVRRTGSGALNIIDLANIDSCCFIATEDSGKVFENNQFEMLGRMDGSDLRGCSLLTA